MATRRMINKADCETMEYKELTVTQRYLYEHLMLQADDDGILPVIYVKPKIFPFDTEYTEEVIQKDLSAIERNKFIHVYENGGNRFIYVLNWWDKQTIRSDIYKETKYPKPLDFVPKPPDLKKNRFKKNVTSNVTENVATDVTQNSEGKRGQARERLGEIRIKDYETGEVDLPFEEDGSTNPLYN